MQSPNSWRNSEPDTPSISECILQVRGLDCPSEVPPIREALENQPGILELQFQASEGRVRVSYDPTRLNPADIASRVRRSTGMHAEPVSACGQVLSEEGSSPSIWQSRRRLWLITAFSGAAVGLGVLAEFSGVSSAIPTALYLAGVAAALVELLPKAVRSLRRLRLGIHLLMTMAIAGAITLGEFSEAATVGFLFVLSEALEALSLARAGNAVRRLLEVAPETAERIEADGSSRTVLASEVAVGDHVRVRSGNRVPVDGVIVEGRSSIDQRSITGESVPVPKGPGDDVYAGTVNGEGGLEIRASQRLKDSVVSKTIELVRSAQSARTPSERLVERFSAVYTPMVFALALLVMIVPPLLLPQFGGSANWSVWFMRGLVVLVVACPCALVIGTPVAVVSALANAARHGILIKGGEYLETIGRLAVLAFDKTGTLTKGQPNVVEVVASNGDSDSMLRVAAAIGDRGGHVLGQAIARHARGRNLEVPAAQDYEAVPGLGATGLVESTEYHMGNHRFLHESDRCSPGTFHEAMDALETKAGTAVGISAAEGPIGYIRLADTARPEAAEVVKSMERLGLRTVMLTGDNPATAASMARQLGLSDYRASLLPADKADAIRELSARYGATGMVGDGVNDAPALATAQVSVALGGISSATALEAANIVLMADDLSRLPWLIRLSRRTRSRIWWNIGLAIGTKAVVLLLAILGYASLWMAIAADVGTTLLVVVNAMRLLRNGDKNGDE